MNLPPMRDRTAIQRAHDILHFVTSPECKPFLNRDASIAASAVHDAMAWVLGFECGHAFHANLEMLKDELREMGYREVDAGRPISAAEARRRGLA